MIRRPVIEIRDLRVIRNRMPAVDVPELVIREGGVVSLIGPNGAGKSTLLLSIMRLIRPDSGEVRYRGEGLPLSRGIYSFRRRMSLVFQEPLLFNTSVFNNIASGLRMRGMGRGDVETAVAQAMELLGITELAKRRAMALSGGEAQRVNLARALASGPDLLLMDEPFTALDAPSREALIVDLGRIIRNRGITAMFATHDRDEAIRLADEIVVMNAGRIVQAGPPGTITQFPVNEFVASFMGTETILTGSVSSARGGVISVSVNGRRVEVVGAAEPGAAVTFCVHPDSIVLSKGRAVTSARNAFRGTVTAVANMGLYRKVYIDCGFTMVAYVTARSAERLGIREGKELTASFKATSAHVIRMG